MLPVNQVFFVYLVIFMKLPRGASKGDPKQICATHKVESIRQSASSGEETKSDTEP